MRGVDLLPDASGRAVAGALLLDQHSGELIAVHATAVLLATGGAAPLYRVTAASLEKSGDGLAMAYRAGAELVDMEMMQFHPTGLVADRLAAQRGRSLEEGLRGAGGHLLNADRERYMARYDPEKMERSTRDLVSRSGMMEIRAGRGTAGAGVHLDVRHLGKDFLLESSPGMYARCLTVGVDMATDLIEVTPTAHFQMGGIRIDADCRTTLEGLFAAGEDAGGVHGAQPPRRQRGGRIDGVRGHRREIDRPSRDGRSARGHRQGPARRGPRPSGGFRRGHRTAPSR